MYLYFNNQGVLKEIVNDEAIRQGNSNINKIRFFIEGAEPQIVNNVYKAITFITGVRTFIDVEGNQLTTESFSLTTSELQIPYDKKRELKFFKYFTKYEMFSITVPDDILNESGTVGCRVQMVSAEGIITLGLIVFNVEITTGGQAIIEPDTAINIAQWNYLITHMTTPENFVMKYDADSSQWDVVPTEGSTKPVTSGGIATAIANALSAVYKLMGTATISDLNDLEKSVTMNGYVYNVSDAGTLVNEDETTVSINADDNVVFVWNDGDWYWDRLGSIFDTSHLVTTNTNQSISGLKTINRNGTLLQLFRTDNSFGYYIEFYNANGRIGLNFRNSNMSTGQFSMRLDGYYIITYSIIPTGDNAYDIGESNKRYRDLYLGGALIGDTLKDSAGNTRFTWSTAGYGYFNAHVLPSATNTRDLGSSSFAWKDLYLSGGVKFSSHTLAEEVGFFVVKEGNLNVALIGSSFSMFRSVIPVSTNLYNLGRSDFCWKDLYLTGAIKGAATMTQAQYDALVSGGTVDADTFYFIEEE